MKIEKTKLGYIFWSQMNQIAKTPQSFRHRAYTGLIMQLAEQVGKEKSYIHEK